MSGSAGPGGGDHGAGRLYGYGDRHPAAGFGVHFGDEDHSGSIFFQDSARGAGGDVAAAGGLTPYSGLTGYLRGFLDPAGLAGHLHAPVYATKRELAVGEMIGHGREAGGASAATPAVTPNSSTSSEPRPCEKGRPAPEAGDGGEGEVDEEDHQDCRSGTKKKIKKEKKARGSRVAFATKSEVDHLDDGYRWRKYGQKAVKNSSFPRSYYRCTTARCGVKKQVERSQQDPSTVVTTYEGQHAHPSPADHRGMANGLYSLAALQQQRHGFCPSSTPNDLAMAPAAAAAASPAALLPRQAESRFAEYYGVQLHDVLLDPLAGNQHGHR